MALTAIIDNLDALDENIRPLYKQAGDKFVLDITDIDSHPNVAGLKSTMVKERDARKDLEKNLNDLKARTDGLDLDKLKGIDPQKYEQAMADLAKYKELEKEHHRKKLEDQGEWEKLEKQLTESHNAELQTLNSKVQELTESYESKISDLQKSSEETIAQMRSTIERRVLGEDLTTAIAEQGGNIAVLRPHVERFSKVIQDEDSGEYVSRVIGEDGQVRMSSSGGPMSLSEFVSELKDKPEFQGEGIFQKDRKPGGSGSGGNRNDGGSPNNPWTEKHFNLTEQGRIMKADPAKAARLKKAAGKG